MGYMFDTILNWEKLNLVQRLHVIGVIVVLSLIISLILISTAIDIYKAFILEKIVSNYGVSMSFVFMAFIPSMVAAALVIFLTIKVGGDDKPIGFFRAFFFALLTVSGLSWCTVLLISIYQLFVPSDFTRNFTEIFGVISTLSLGFSIAFGFIVWMVVVITSENHDPKTNQPLS